MIATRPRPLPVVAAFILGVLAILGIALTTARAAEEPSAAQVAAVDDGSGSGSGSGSAATAPVIPADPVIHPVATIDTLKAAKQIGWACLAFAILTVTARVVGRLGKDVKQLAWLHKGKAAVIVGAVGALALATYNALALGGTLLAAALAGLVALAHYLDATPPEAA